ncbi:phage baseplate protein [Chryseobacterium sp. MFBS3-17]|uniref:phage baseplate protein n=1 Tax=Chryseobacterium sp. MFBS3-17 TaxID=2886689 RepID=UPI001D0E4BBE|nr:hypothetical protein [Chryseobacterium sp. MFBS3-17]MCC2590370.1 hypothetical protein [Chryseobacterium sp. MFBS3-17]
MKLSFNFLQTGGVPLTNDLMALIEESYGIFEVLGDLAGHQTILAGCEPVTPGSNTLTPGIVAISGKLYYFEGGVQTSEVFIHTEQIQKVFEDQTTKTLIEVKTVRFGVAVPPNAYTWANFVRLKKLLQMQDMATQTALNALITRVELLELKTAPVINGGIVWPWNKPVADIPAGWKECTDLRGKVIVGRDPNDATFSALGGNVGSKTHQLTIAEMPNHSHTYSRTIFGVQSGSGSSTNGSKVSHAVTENTSSQGDGLPHNIIQPSRICNFIEPNFP